MRSSHAFSVRYWEAKASSVSFQSQGLEHPLRVWVSGHTVWFLHRPGASWVVAGCQSLALLFPGLGFALGVEGVDQALLETGWKDGGLSSY